MNDKKTLKEMKHKVALHEYFVRDNLRPLKEIKAQVERMREYKVVKRYNEIINGYKGDLQ